MTYKSQFFNPKSKIQNPVTDIHQLLSQLAQQENQLRSTQFIAPCVRSGKVRTKVAGIVYNFTVKPRKFEGWGIFQAINDKTVQMVEEASLPQISQYLQQFPLIRLQLAYCLQGQTWLAYPVNEAEAKQRLGLVKPLPIHLVTEGTTFESIIGRWDGVSCWFEECDRRADFSAINPLQSALKQEILPEQLQFKGMTPEMRIVYDLVTQQIEGFSQQQRDNKRLQKALKIGGGELQQFQDKGDYWRVEWTTNDGNHHISAITKSDLTVMSSGICLSGRDRDFDLQSLVGVIEQQE